jgi:hypothetical protein
MLLPPSDSKFIDRRAEIVAALKKIVPDGVVADPSGLATFDSDALSAYHQMPLVCVLPSNREQVSAILKYAQEVGVPIVPRRYPAVHRANVIGMGRMQHIIEIDYENGCVVANPASPTQYHQGGGSQRFLLRARSSRNRLHRRQCGGKFGWTALPEIRPHHQQSSPPHHGAAGWGDCDLGRQIGRAGRA